MAQLLFDECNSHDSSTPNANQTTEKVCWLLVVENPLLPATA